MHDSHTHVSADDIAGDPSPMVRAACGSNLNLSRLPTHGAAAVTGKRSDRSALDSVAD